jgi:adenine phosphoribosyltransferase
LFFIFKLNCDADKVGADVVECACVIELPELNGRSKLGNAELFILIKKEGL